MFLAAAVIQPFWQQVPVTKSIISHVKNWR
jgi:hypothetical protein